MEIFMNDLYSRLKDIRKRAGLSSSDMAKKLGMSQPHYSNMENGNRRIPSSVVEKFAEVLDMPISEIYQEKAEYEKSDAESPIDLDYIKNRRKDLNIPSGDFANKLGLSPSYWSNIESGNRTIPVEILPTVADLLDCTIQKLFKKQRDQDRFMLAPGVYLDPALAEDLARLIEQEGGRLLREVNKAYTEGPPGLRQALDFLLKGDPKAP